MRARGLDAVALVPSANLFYLTGIQMQLSERVTLAFVTPEGPVHLIVPALEVPRVEARARVPLELHPWTDAEWDAAGWKALRASGALAGRTVGVDYYSVRGLELARLKEAAPNLSVMDASELFTDLRLVKDDEEIGAMRRAAGVLDASIAALLPEVRPGVTERELAARWQWLMFERGADAIPDTPIVATGPNSAQPHTTATGRAVELGDLLILDGWCTVDGYYGDITRTFAVGQVSDKMREIYDVTRRANEAGRAAVKADARCQDIDRAARAVIAAAGYGKEFVHRTGHGLGLDVHEAPNIVEGDTRSLLPGVTFTVEPGIYLADQGGVRIEDDVVVTLDGGESLTHSPRELRVL